MAGVEVQASVIYPGSTGGRTTGVGVAVRPCLLVHVGEEGVDGLVDIVGPAEATDVTGLITGVTEPLQFTHTDLLLPCRNGPERTVTPCPLRPVGGEHLVGVDVLPRLDVEDVGGILTDPGVIEQAAQVVSGGVDGLDPDPLSDAPCHGLVLLGQHGPGGGEEPAEPGMLGGVGVGGVAGTGDATVEQGEVVPVIRGRMVGVEGDHTPLPHMLRLPHPVGEVTGDEAPGQFLEDVSLLLAHGPVLPHGLGGTHRGLQPGTELLP